MQVSLRTVVQQPGHCRHHPSLLLQIITSAVVLAVSLVLCAISLMGLSQGDREQRGYEALSRAAVTGLTDELQLPAGLEESQQLQIGPSSACSTDSGTKFTHLNFLQSSLCRHFYIWVQLDQNIIFVFMLPDIHSFPSLQTLPDMIASTQLSNGIKHKFLIFFFFFF